MSQIGPLSRILQCDDYLTCQDDGRWVSQRLVAIGVPIFIIGLASFIFAFILPSLVTDAIDKGVLGLRVIPPEDSGQAYRLWVNNTQEGDAPEFLSFYIFNLTNGPAFLQGAKAEVYELGPFEYRQYWAKFDLKREKKNSQLFFYKQQWWLPANELARNAPTTYVTTAALGLPVVKLNVPDAHPGGWFGDDRWYKDMIGDVLASMGDGHALSTLPAHELIFGASSPFLLWIRSHIAPQIPKKYVIQFNDTSREETRKRMGGQTAVWNAPAQLNQLIQWDGMEWLYENRTWGTPDANRVKGTDGRSFSPNLPASHPLTVFLPLGFRHFQFHYQKAVDFLGLSLRRYVLSDGQLNNTCNSVTNPDCLPYHLYSLPSGLLNVTQAVKEQQGFWSPIFASTPYFLGADSFYSGQVEFMNGHADPSRHQTFFDIEPFSGLTMRGYQRTQVNYYLKNSALLYPNMTTSQVLPILWQEMHAQANANDAKLILDNIYHAQSLQKILTFVGILVGSVTTIISIIVFRFAWTHRQGVVYAIYAPISADHSDVQYGTSYGYGTSADFGD